MDREEIISIIRIIPLNAPLKRKNKQSSFNGSIDNRKMADIFNYISGLKICICLPGPNMACNGPASICFFRDLINADVVIISIIMALLR